MQTSVLSELLFAGCCCCCSFFILTGRPPSRRHRESGRLFLSFAALICHKHFQNKVQFDPRKSQEAYLFVVYIYKLLSM